MQLKDLKWIAGWNLSFFCSLCSSAFLPISSLVIQSLSRVWLCNPWSIARQASQSSTVSRNLLRFMSIESVMPSNHLILCCPLLLCLKSFPASGSFPMSQFFASGSQRIGASALASVLPVNIQGWFPLGLTGLISLQSKELSRVFSSTTIWKHQYPWLILYIVHVREQTMCLGFWCF